MGALSGRFSGALEASRPLGPGDDCTGFACGEPALDEWLVRPAPRSQREGSARGYVACAGGRVVAYHALARGSVARALAPGRVRRNMPEPVPIMLLARLAVDRDWQGRGLGASLLARRDALLPVLRVSRAQRGSDDADVEAGRPARGAGVDA